jgi:F0F1-type ATP synthase assembly protein I
VPRTSGKPTSIWTQVAFYTSLGLILPAGTVGGFLLGWYVDRWLHTTPALAVVLGILGAAGAIVEVLQILKRTEKNDNRNNSHVGPARS